MTVVQFGPPSPQVSSNGSKTNTSQRYDRGTSSRDHPQAIQVSLSSLTHFHAPFWPLNRARSHMAVKADERRHIRRRGGPPHFRPVARKAWTATNTTDALEAVKSWRALGPARLTGWQGDVLYEDGGSLPRGFWCSDGSRSKYVLVVRQLMVGSGGDLWVIRCGLSYRQMRSIFVIERNWFPRDTKTKNKRNETKNLDIRACGCGSTRYRVERKTAVVRALRANSVEDMMGRFFVLFCLIVPRVISRDGCIDRRMRIMNVMRKIGWQLAPSICSSWSFYYGTRGAVRGRVRPVLKWFWCVWVTDCLTEWLTDWQMKHILT